MDQEKIGKFIAKLRKEKMMTQQELADKIGVTDRAVSNWENGRRMPDLSLIKSLCDELGITINELLSGTKVNNYNIGKISNDNLEAILKEYDKMKKHKKILKTSLFVVGISCIMLIFSIISILSVGSFFSIFGKKEVITDINKYSKAHYLEKYKGDLNSNLSIFPDKMTSDMKNVEFESSMSVGLLDTDGYIYLKYQLEEEAFHKEINRIKQIEVTITNHNNKKYTNHILYDAKSFIYPAYITADGFGNVYEYALINESEKEIIYIYISYPNIKTFKYLKYLKKDLTSYIDYNTLDKFTIYNHSFDGGQVFIEFDD